MKIQNLLQEAGNPSYAPISATNIVELVTNYAGGAAAVLADDKLVVYRGVRDAPSDIFIQDTLVTVRTSQNTHNYVTMLTAVLPTWRGVPARSTGVSCTSSSDTAYDYGHGNLFVAIPCDGATTVYCGERDFWYCFPGIRQHSSKPNMLTDVVELNNALDAMLNAIEARPGYPRAAKTQYSEFVKALSMIDAIAQDERDPLYKAMADNNTLFDSYLESSFDTIFELLNAMLRPDNLRIASNGGILKPGRDEEVFISGRVLYIKKQLWAERNRS